ncbi:MAG: hypothetical protein ACKVOL_11735 [Novosphingobium sp.]
MMLLKNGLLAAALAASTITGAAPAQAHGDDAAIAIGAGVVGLAVGAAIASSHNDRGYYENDRGYYEGGYYRSYPRYRGGYNAPAYPQYRAYPAYRGYEDSYDRYDRYRRYRAHERGDYRGGGRGW